MKTKYKYKIKQGNYQLIKRYGIYVDLPDEFNIKYHDGTIYKFKNPLISDVKDDKGGVVKKGDAQRLWTLLLVPSYTLNNDTIAFQGPGSPKHGSINVKGVKQ